MQTNQSNIGGLNNQSNSEIKNNSNINATLPQESANDNDSDFIEDDRDHEDNSEHEDELEREEKEHPHKYTTPKDGEVNDEKFYEFTNDSEVLKEQKDTPVEPESTIPINDQSEEMFHE